MMLLGTIKDVVAGRPLADVASCQLLRLRYFS